MARKSVCHSLLCVTACAALAIPVTVRAAEPADSVADHTNTCSDSIRLGEVEVKALMQRTDARVSTYIPDKRQKKASQSAGQLLSAMAIPQLRAIGPDAVTAMNGKAISYFIDKVPATAEDLSGMRTTDVLRVEYMEYPDDPRFMHAPVVVNFVMVKYEWGGYTKLSGNVAPLIADHNFGGSAYSKFAYRKMTYDVSAGGSYSASDHPGGSMQATYLLPDFKGHGPLTVNRMSENTGGLYRHNREHMSARALFDNESLTISNIVSASWSRTPEQRSEHSLLYDCKLAESGRSVTRSAGRGNSLGWAGHAFLRLPHDYSMMISGDVTYTHSSADRTNTVDNKTIFSNPTRENAWSTNWQAGAGKTFGGKHTFRPIIIFHSASNRVRYPGNEASPTMRYSSIMAVGYVSYAFNSEKWSIDANAMWRWDKATIGQTETNINSTPLLSLSGAYSPGQRHRVSVQAMLGADDFMPGYLNPTPQQIDQLMWIKGNPQLKTPKGFNLTASYLWMPSNVWQINTSCQYLAVYDNRTAVYTPDGPDGAMLQQFVNSGSYQWVKAGIHGSLKLLENALIINIGPQITHSSTSSVNRNTHTDINCYANATYYAGQFSFGIYYCTENRRVEQYSGALYREPETYSLTAGWGDSRWNLRFTATNFLRWSYDYGTRATLTTAHYSHTQVTGQAACHAAVSLSATFTFGYGKRMVRGNDTISAGSTSSAVMP